MTHLDRDENKKSPADLAKSLCLFAIRTSYLGMGEVQLGSEARLEQPRCSQCPWLGVEPARGGLGPAGVMGALFNPKHVMWNIDFLRI